MGHPDLGVYKQYGADMAFTCDSGGGWGVGGVERGQLEAYVAPLFPHAPARPAL